MTRNIGKNMVLFLLLLVMIALPERLQARDLVASDSRADSILTTNTYIRFVEEGETVHFSDEEFFDQAGRVVFPVNDYRLPPDAPLLKQLEKEVLPAINREGYTLSRIYIRGAASPEGSYEHNKVLGEKRAKALTDFVLSRLSVPVSDGSYNLDVDYEDYRSLCLFLSRAQDSYYVLVKSICDKYLPSNNVAQLKEELQQAEGGKLWKHLLTNYFPSLRTARIMLVFKQKQPVEVIPQPAEEQPVPEPVIVEQPVAEAPVTAAVVFDEPEILPRREYLSVKTNLLLDGAYVPGYNRWCPIPNVAIEYYPKKGHFTYGASFDFPWWQDYDAHKYFQIRNYQLESRYYLRSGSLSSNPPGEGAAFRGLYLQAYAHVALFGICFDADRGWVGEGVGAGVGVGYVLPLSKKGHWRLEFGLQAGYFRCKYDPYQYENPVDPSYHDDLYYYKWTLDPDLFKKRQYRYNWLGPTRVGITLTYDLLYRRINKKGVSFKNYEKR